MLPGVQSLYHQFAMSRNADRDGDYVDRRVCNHAVSRL